MSELHVVEPGLLTSVQDVVGRPAHGRYGVPESGPLDGLAARAANVLVGNPPEAGLLEITVSGPTLRFADRALVALTGAELPATLDGRPVPADRSVVVSGGGTLRIGERRNGARAYLAIAGGIATAPVLGSRATDVRNRLGGSALRAGDRLPIGDPAGGGTGRQLPWPLPLDGPVRVLPGPHLPDRETLERLCSAEWQVDPRSDRQGCRLIGPPLEGGEVASCGLPPGAVQVPPDGQPIALLADRQPTGGYPVVAVVVTADLRIIGQRVPGETLRFAISDEDEARAARAADAAFLADIGPAPDDPWSWAGALE